MTIDALQQQVATLTTEVERLTNDRNLEKRWRKDSDERAEILTEALEQIRDKQGVVCTYYESCNHESCASSYAAWAIADKALAAVAMRGETR